MRRGGAALLLLALGAPGLHAEGPRRIRIEADDVVVTESVVVEPGTYRVRDADGDGVLHVRGNGLRVDLTGVTLDGAADGEEADAFSGVGIAVEGRKAVTIRGGRVRGFRVGVRVVDSHELLLEGVDASGNFRRRLRSTPEREDPSDWLWPHENDEGQWERAYGAGFSLTRCWVPRVERCVVRRGQNGLLLSRCEEARVVRNDFSFNSGWGIALWRTRRSVLDRNACDWCVRGYSHGVYARGQDSAAILLFEQCSENEILGNSATHSGDGLFLYAGHETTRRTGTGGSNRNLVSGNDFSFAVANGIEATFSEGNRFLGNDASGSDYGVWAGYSRRTEVRGNRLDDCLTAGVAIEHGQENRVEGNSIAGAARRGVWLWWDEDRDLLDSPFCRGRDCTSSRNVVVGNRIAGAGEPVRLDGDRDSDVRDNGPDAPQAAHDWDGRPPRRLPEGMPRGRDQIRVDEWGPVDPRESRVFPSRVDAAGNVARFWVLGAEPARVLSTTPGVAAALEGGRGPGLSVTNASPDGPAVLPFRLEVALGDRRQTVEGSLLVARWDVRWFRWTKDPREDAAAFATLLAGEPVERREAWALDLPWRHDGPRPDLTDRFATLATTTVRLPAGRYRVRTLSDDGVRVLVDGKVVLENWTWHGPTEDLAEVTLAEGEHALRVEHFEIDGWAHLGFRLEPARR